jgi:3-oxoacyl-[acyl-carrier protein] reductase
VELTDAASVASAVDATISKHGRIDILVNNAGIAGGNGLTWELDPAVWRRVIDVNLVGPFLACRAVIPHLLANGYGRIVNVASIAGKEGNPTSSHYSASKAGLIGLTKSLGKELATKNILVNCVTPAAASTEIFAQMKRSTSTCARRSRWDVRRSRRDYRARLLAGLEMPFSTGAVFDISGGRPRTDALNPSRRSSNFQFSPGSRTSEANSDAPGPGPRIPTLLPVEVMRLALISPDEKKSSSEENRDEEVWFPVYCAGRGGHARV